MNIDNTDIYTSDCEDLDNTYINYSDLISIDELISLGFAEHINDFINSNSIETGTFENISDLHIYIYENIGLGIAFYVKRYIHLFNNQEALSIIYKALYEAAVKWNPDKSKFSTYSYWWLRKYFIEATTAVYKHREDREEVTEIIISDEGSQANSMISQMDLETLKQTLYNNNVSTEDFEIFYDRCINGMSFPQIKKKYSIKGSTQYKFNKIRQELKDILKEINYA